MKHDGHTHTGYCNHGSKEETELFVLRAIALGFDTYSVTEHPPLPSDFLRSLPYEPSVTSSIPMDANDMDSYIRDMLHLKEMYKDRINLLVGLEIDFLPEHQVWTRQLLSEYGPWLDDGVISVHFLPGSGGWRCVDLSPQDAESGLVAHYGDVDAFKLA